MTSEKADIPAIATKGSHLTTNQKSDLQSLLTKHESMFDGSIGDWNKNPVSLELTPSVTPYYGKPYPVTVHSKN